MPVKTATYVVPPRNANGGCLYLVATPIGNLEDITLRALRVLKEVDLIACEDTRQTARLLNAYGIQKPLISYHEHNEMVRAPELVLELEEGAKVALVSDAGTPAISDPGDRLITLAIRHGIRVVPVPGATAFGAALMASGLHDREFHFVGYLPARRTARRKALQALRAQTATLVFYEAPHRIAESLADMEMMLGDRHAVLARELTKVHEEFLRGSLSQLRATARKRELKGEITLLVAPAENRTPEARLAAGASVRARVEHLQKKDGLELKAALKTVARELGLSRSEAYRRLQEEKALGQ
ncbi:MAG TPA: 16S rRNA (cytidine(1402)-2'-O)-methyltransferase [Candidatus Xenobia bacterium]|nr:16S rRNA (cytidine(1402)-2'-O)-methyltransferase [Candidatus Xenobia bacterium]